MAITRIDQIAGPVTIVAPRVPDSFKGPKGDNGAGVASGGASNDLLIKQSAADFDTGWSSAQSLGLATLAVNNTFTGDNTFELGVTLNNVNVQSYQTRAAFVAAAPSLTPNNGDIVETGDGLRFYYASGSTELNDLLGWVPATRDQYHFSTAQAYLRNVQDGKISVSTPITATVSAGKAQKNVALSTSDNSFGVVVRVDDFNLSGVVESSNAIFPLAVTDSAKRFSLHNINVSSEKVGADSWPFQIKPGLSGILTISSVNTTNDTLLINNNPFVNGDQVRYFSGGTPASPLVNNTDYFVVGVSGSTLQLSATSGGSAIDITTAGTGTQTLALTSLWAQNGLVYGNHVYGKSDDVAMGISVDGDTRNTVIIANTVDRILRVSNVVRGGHALGQAGAFADIGTSKEAYNNIWVANAVTNASNMWHVEDNAQGTLFALNVAEAIEKGFEIDNGQGVNQNIYLANVVRGASNYFIDAVGIGSTFDTAFAFNVFNGAGVTQAVVSGGAACRINQPNTKNIIYTGNVHANFTSSAFSSDALGPIVISSNVFNGIADDAVSFTRTAAKGLISSNVFDTIGDDAIQATGAEVFTFAGARGVLVESNNFFRAISGTIVDKANSQNIIGDQTVISEELDAAVASESLVHVFPRAGWVTAVCRVHTTAGTASGNATFTVKKVPEGGGSSTTIISRPVPGVSAQYSSFVWTSVNANLVENSFAKGDILIVECDGAATTPGGKFKIEVEFFYAN